MQKSKLIALKKEIKTLILPIKPISNSFVANPELLFTAKRTEAGNFLPAYYFVYFLFIDLLGFKNLGQFEKVSWSIPIEYKGKVYLIEYRKMGLGIFVEKPESEESHTQEIVKLINKAVKKASPFFEYQIFKAISESKINVVNHSGALFDRYQFLSSQCKIKQNQLNKITSRNSKDQKELSKIYQLDREISWIALSVVEAFFSWTEHVLIHIAILDGHLRSAEELKKLTLGEWGDKFKKALTLNDPIDKRFYESLLVIRQELRNFIAHGSFGKNGEALHFHSGTGAVPVQLTQEKNKRKFRIGSGLRVSAHEVLDTLEKFNKRLWSGRRARAKLYIQNTDLPSILTFAFDGSYSHAMSSTKEMKSFIQNLEYQFDRAANMDW